MSEPLYLAMALYGSGIQSPVGVFESEDLAKEAIFELGNPTSYSVTPMNLNQNWEKWARVERDKYKEWLGESIERFDFVWKPGSFEIHISSEDVDVLENQDTICGYRMGKKWVVSKEWQKRRDICYKCREKSGQIYPNSS